MTGRRQRRGNADGNNRNPNGCTERGRSETRRKIIKPEEIERRQEHTEELEYRLVVLKEKILPFEYLIPQKGISYK